MNLEELKKKRSVLDNRAENTLRNMEMIAEESRRVADVARNSKQILNDLDLEFELQTGLTKTDISFLLLATALQCARQYILANTQLYITDDKGSALTKKIIPKQWHEILSTKVPYDISAKADSGLDTGISGRNHRYSALGHDPILGWIFGTMNILTDSLTPRKSIFNPEEIC